MRCLALFIPLVFLTSLNNMKPNDVLELSRSKLEQGDFKGAEKQLQTYLQTSEITPEQERLIAFEIERIKRIGRDYSLTKEELFSQLKESIPTLSQQQFQEWIDEGRFDTRRIDGKQYFMYASRSNLFFRYPDARAMRVDTPDATEYENKLWTEVSEAIETAKKTGQRYVNPIDFEATMRITVDADAVEAGDTIRCWMPYPRIFPHQTDVELISSNPSVKWIAKSESPIRSLYFEQVVQKGEPTVFLAKYRFRTYAVAPLLGTAVIQPYDANDLMVTYYTCEQEPHIVFSDKLKKLSKEIMGNEKNPLVKARKIYDWIAKNIVYSYAVEYSTILNISDYCYTHRYGDCGQEALLFITLCRLNGIPARWQSGWYTMPGGKTIHDWAEFYVEPYGWLPCDQYMGVAATHYLFTLSQEQRDKIKDYYFGGLDRYRMIANSDCCRKLYPPKKGFRSDNVDFQRGELETNGTNIYFGKYSYSLTIETK